jgi:hypothetical protein
LGIGQGAVAGHLPAAQGANDGVGVLDGELVIEQIKRPEFLDPALYDRGNWGAVLQPKAGQVIERFVD